MSNDDKTLDDIQELMRLLENTPNSKKISRLRTEIDLRIRTICYEEQREQKTQYAVGDIQLDGIAPTSEFQEYAEKEKRGELSLEDKQQFLRKPYTTEQPSTAEVHALSERFLNKNKEAYKSLASAPKERPE